MQRICGPFCLSRDVINQYVFCCSIYTETAQNSREQCTELADLLFWRLRIIVPLKVDGTSFSDAGSLVTTAHLTREICPRDLKYRKSKTNMWAQKLLLTRCFFSCPSEIGSKQKLFFWRQLLSNSVCVQEKHFLELNARNSRLEFPAVWRSGSILSAIAISNNLKTTGFHHTDRL